MENMIKKNFPNENFLQKNFAKVILVKNPFPYQNYSKGFFKERKGNVFKNDFSLL